MSGSYARALSPDSTPPPPVSRHLHFIEAASDHGATLSGSRHPRLSAEHIGRIFRPTTSTGPNTSLEAPPIGPSTPYHRPRGEVRNPADWLRADDYSPETSPERDAPCASVLGLSVTASGTLDPAGRGALLHDDPTPAQAKRARPTWVTRTPTPPLAIRFPNTPPITPAQGGLVFTRTTDAQNQSTSEAQAPELQDEVDADDEMSEDEDVRYVKQDADQAGGEGARERSDQMHLRRAASVGTRHEGEPVAQIGEPGKSTISVQVEHTAIACTAIAMQADIDNGNHIATRQSSAVQSKLYDTTKHQASVGCPAETSAAHVEENVEDERGDEEAEERGTTDAENDVEDMIDDIAGRGTDKDRAISPYSPAGATDSSSIGRAMTEEAGMEWEEASCGYRLPGAQRLKTT